MIKNEYEYQQTLELIEKLEKVIEALPEENKDKPKWLSDLIAEAPLDDLEKLKAEADEYVRLKLKAS